MYEQAAPPQECHCALQYPRAMSKVIKGLRSRLRLRGRNGCDREALRKRKSFLLAHKPHAIRARSCLYSRSRTQAVRAFIRERRKYAYRDQSSRPCLTRKDGPVRVLSRGWFGATKMRFIRPTSRKSQALAPTHRRKKQRDLKLNAILQSAVCSRNRNYPR